jgi:hypothetical protein
VARFGGDELVVLSEHITGEQDACVIAERILATLRTPFSVDGEEVTLSASIGICLAPVEGRSRDELLASADRAMYLAKGAGPGRYVVAGAEAYHPRMARLIRMDTTGHSTLAEWTAGDHEAIERAVAEFRRELDSGYYAMVTEGEGHARQVTELPLDAELVILRRPIAGG